MSITNTILISDVEALNEARWDRVVRALQTHGFDPKWNDSSSDFTSEEGWKRIVEDGYPTSTAFLLMDAASDAQARILVNITPKLYRGPEPDAPLCFEWATELEEALAACTASIEIQPLFLRDESLEFFLAVQRRMAFALKGLIYSESERTLSTARGQPCEPR